MQKSVLIPLIDSLFFSSYQAIDGPQNNLKMYSILEAHSCFLCGLQGPASLHLLQGNTFKSFKGPFIARGHPVSLHSRSWKLVCQEWGGAHQAPPLAQRRPTCSVPRPKPPAPSSSVETGVFHACASKAYFASSGSARQTRYSRAVTPAHNHPFQGEMDCHLAARSCRFDTNSHFINDV